ncbi:molybdenum cofactor guanylyltransferase [Guptibacillus algicola]|uniref:molybdenum cofactor guanylyltransferase n=1 Tax=Guptibacillus algicola TaxID=225844 RepID=UPI001CD6E196|nr:molybdenum cofactor guanylyltransferase [Alkalihalobacillus algicola]MCA0986038.1 molybdenum cofactor guanylyltransferase [Alkalihalobacillus algicola]
MRICGVLLAGGASRRFGSDKAFIDYEGVPFYSKILNELELHVNESIVVTKPELINRFQILKKVEVITDEQNLSGNGPLAGMLTAMNTKKAANYVVVACDMPLVTAELFSKLLDEAERYPNADAIIPVANGRIQPLCAVYRYACKEMIDQKLQLGSKRVMDVLEQLNTRYVAFNESSHLFSNVNTKEDYTEIRRGREG